MGLLNIFKKKKAGTPPRRGAGKKAEKKIEKKEVGKEKKIEKEQYFAPIEGVKTEEIKKEKKIKKKETAKVQGKKAISKIAYRVLISPHISEKATNLSEKNKYVFKIKTGANKVEVREAIKDIYGVDAIDVKIINVHRKKRKLGKQTGWRKGYKKAIVKVKKGQKIELLSR